MRKPASPFVAIAITLFSCKGPTSVPHSNWEITGGGQDKIRYSALGQIDTNNVQGLRIAWTYHSENNDSTKFGVMETNPIVVGHVLYGVSPKLKAFAVDAATGKELWKFDPTDTTINKRRWNNLNVNRGVSYWQDGNDKRIIFTAGPFAYSLDALTGKPIASFGQEGSIDLRKGLGLEESSMFIAPTSPAMIHKNLFILSGLVEEETPGHIRAFDVRTGKQKWIFHTIPHPGEKGFETWEDKNAYQFMGSTNSWAGFSLDEKRGILYAPTGNPSNDFYGGRRNGDALFGNCLLAIDAETGKLKWFFQTVHHDVWDMDLPTPPALVTIDRDGKKTDVVVQTTKTGMVFILDRETGKPVYPVNEVPLNAQTTLKGERLSPTQPFPEIPTPFVRQQFSEADLNDLVSDSSYRDILARFKSLKGAGIFTPPATEGTIVLPGYDGGGEWGGPAVDPETNKLYVNANEMPWVLKMVERKARDLKKEKTLTRMEAGKRLYIQYCMRCHGAE